MALYHGEKIKIFALSSNKSLAKEVSDILEIPLSSCEITRFADGEISVNIDETVRGHKVFVIQSTSNPVNDNLMELLIFMDALKRASAKEINIVLPYYGYCRQDRKAKSRQPISAKLVADLLTAAGATRVICLDLHAAQIQGFFNIPIDNLQGMPLFHKYIDANGITDFVVVSPDHGGANRARALAEPYGIDIAIIDKRRPRPNVSEVMNIIGDVQNKNCVIIDDLIDTGGSVYEVTLNKMGYRKVGDIAKADPTIFKKRYGVLGEELWYHTHGIDMSLIQDKKKFKPLSKSYGVGQVMFEDYNKETSPEIILEMADDLSSRLRQTKKKTKTIHLSIGYNQTYGGGFSRQMKLKEPINLGKDIQKACLELFDKYYNGEPIRRFQISVSGLVDDSGLQLSLFEDKEKKSKEEKLLDTMDEIKKKYGKNSIRRASTELEYSTAKKRNQEVGGHHE